MTLHRLGIALVVLALAHAAPAAEIQEPCKNHYILDDCPAPTAKSPNSYRFTKAFSSPSGDYQLLQMQEMDGLQAQHRLAGMLLVAVDRHGNVRRMTIPQDLPSDKTAHRPFVFSTFGGGDLALPPGFVPTDGGTIELVGVDRWDLPPLPRDGLGALLRYPANQPYGLLPFQRFGGGSLIGAMPQQYLVEYRHAATNRYFATTIAGEIDALDSGREPGWTRTGDGFLAWINHFSDPYEGDEAYAPATAILRPVCRVYVPPPVGPTHVLSVFPDECAAVARDVAGAVVETGQAFLATMPDAATGRCSRDFVPLYRLWNGASSRASHRFTTQRVVRDAMVAQGWVGEGYGPDGVAMCVVA